MNDEADTSDTQLRVSCDAKAAVKIGDYSRLGSNRVKVQAADHDFKPEDIIVPFGLYLPKHKELSLFLARSKITADFIVDCLEAWWTAACARFPNVTMLVLDLDNGPENHSRRTQFVKRLVEFVDQYRIDVRLAYYPPYHSKYNPIERCWGGLEQHWNGTLLDSIAAVVGYAQSFRWQGLAPVVQLVHQVYQTGVRLTRFKMAQVEARLSRFESLGRWFVDIAWTPASSSVPLAVS